MSMKKDYGKQIQDRIKENWTKINEYKMSGNGELDKLIAESEKMYNSMDNYAKLRDSMDELRMNIENARYESAKLKEARLSDKLIDISRCDIPDPNKLLWDMLQDKKNALGKLVALPHRSISVEELISEAGIKLTDSQFATNVIKFVDKLIEKRI